MKRTNQQIYRGIEFLELPTRKMVLFSSVIGAVGLIVWATFIFSGQRFGDLPLSTALQRESIKELRYLHYWAAYTFDAPGAAIGRMMGTSFGYERENREVAKAVPVLMYHAIVHEPDGNNVTQDTFSSHLFALKKAGWETVTQKEFLAFLDGSLSLPEKSFVLAFDDGAKDSYYPVDPLLRVLDYSALTFILTKYSVGDGSFYYLSAGEVRDMLSSGRWEIGSHGHDSHAFVPIDEHFTIGAALANRLWLPDENRVETPDEYRARVQHELQSSRALLEQTFATPVASFAFPFGDFGQLSLNHPDAGQVVPQVARTSYNHAYYQTRYGDTATWNYPLSTGSPFMVRRIEPLPSWSAEELLAALEKGSPKELPFTDQFMEPLGWLSVWGTFSLRDGVLSMAASDTTNGNAVLLDGSNYLTDHSFSVTIDEQTGEGVVLWARFMDGRNNASCNFGSDFVHVEEIVDGQKRVASGIRGEGLFPPDGSTLSIVANGRSIECAINGETVVSNNFISSSLSQGSVGIKIWHPVPGVSALTVREATIEQL